MKQNLRPKMISLNVSHVLNTIILYIKEFKQLKLYVISVSLVLICSYSVFLFLNDNIVTNLGKEDHFFEWITTVYLLLGAIILFIFYLKTKNYFVLLLSLVLFFGCGEEISWGQRIIEFNTPESIKNKNKQAEFTVHNLEIFSKTDLKGKTKKGFERLFEINFLFRLFTMVWGIVLPVLVFHIKFINQITLKLKIPIPPLSIGVFFFINWFTYWTIHNMNIISQNTGLERTSTEIFESIGAFLIFVICLYFFVNINKIETGNDIKEIIH